MHNFKKVIMSFGAVMLIFLVISALLMEPYLLSDQEHKTRASLSGHLNFLVIGASNSLCAYDPRVIDPILGCESYNLSGRLMTLNARDFLLKKELDRNPVDIVVLDLSYEAVTRIESGEHAEGDSIFFTRLDNLVERMRYLITGIPLNDWPYVYTYQLLPNSLEYIIGKLRGDKADEIISQEAQLKGFYGHKSVNVELTVDEARDGYEKSSINTAFREKNIRQMSAIIDECKKYGVRVVLAVTPVPNARIWTEKNQDTFYKWAIDFAQEKDCELYDFNLMKERYELFDEKTAFHDNVHMSESGAEIFSKVFCDILEKVETEDVSRYFYDSYEEMKADSPYMDYLK